MNNLPKEIINYIKEYIRYDVMHIVCKRSNEIKIAKLISQTPSAHAIYIMICRFLWRWRIDLSDINIFRYPRRLNFGDDSKAYFVKKLRESYFIEESLFFHKKWHGPNIPYPKWSLYYDQQKKEGIYYGSC